MITYEKIKNGLMTVFIRIRSYDKTRVKGRALIYQDNKQIQMINSKLITILSNPIENPIMDENQAFEYYFTCDKAQENLIEKYQLIMDVKNLITDETSLPFVYDKLIILKMLQISLPTYNSLLTYCENKVVNESLGNLFIDIDTTLLMERNLSAEIGLKDYKAVDGFNKYKRKSSGYGVTTEENNPEIKKSNEIRITLEDNEKLLSNFGFSKMLEQGLQQNNSQDAKQEEKVVAKAPKKRGRKKKNE